MSWQDEPGLIKPREDYTTESGHRADPQRIVDLIHDKLEDLGVHIRDDGPSKQLSWDNPQHRQLIRGAFENPSREEALLPGFGELGKARNARDDCGENHPFVCDECGQRVDFGRTCAQSVCARCSVAWCRNLGIKKSAKLRRVRKVQYGATPDDEHPKFHHLIVSAEAEWYYHLGKAGFSLEEAQKITKAIVKKILEEMRAQGVLVRHSYRGAHRDGSLREEKHDMGAWKERLFHERDFYGDVRGELGWKPHYHAIVAADWLRGGDFTKQIEEATGWVIHRIADDEGYSLRNDGDMAAVVTYCLSHADIDVRKDQSNRSCVWEVGSFYGDLPSSGERRGGAIKSTPVFSPTEADLQWADARVRTVSWRILGLRSGSTECGAPIPPVAEPDEFARRILEELYPEDEEARREISTDAVLNHVAAGNITVSVSTFDGAGGNVSVRGWDRNVDLGSPSGGLLGGSASDMPSTRRAVATSSSSSVVQEPESPSTSDEDTSDACDEGCECGDQEEECVGTLIPLGEFRERELLDDPEWCRDAPHVDQARKADLEEPEELERWRTKSPGTAIGVG